MKKLIALLLTVVMCLSLCACGGMNEATEAEVMTKDEMLNAATEEAAKVEATPEETTISEETTEPEETTIPEETTEPEETTVPKDIEPELVDGMRPEFKESMDAYEAFYDEYCEFMTEYSENPSDLMLLVKYGELMIKAEEMDKAFEEWDEDELNDAELKYYLEVSNRVMQKMIDIAG